MHAAIHDNQAHGGTRLAAHSAVTRHARPRFTNDTSKSVLRLNSTQAPGIGIDDEVAFTVEDVASPEDFFSHRDDQNTLLSITDANGTVSQRFRYGDYWEPRVLDESGSVSSGDALTPHLYTERPVTAGTGLLEYRYRVMDPELGLWLDHRRRSFERGSRWR